MNARAKLIESTQELLWERGYTATSPKAIQDRAGVGQGSMYHHFAGKADLAAAAITATAGQLKAGVEEAIAEGTGTAYERLAAYLRRERPVMRGCRVGRLVQEPEVVENDQLRAPLGEAFAWRRDLHAQLLAEGMAAGDIRAVGNPDEVAATLLAVLQGGYVLARAAGSEEPYHAAIEGVLALLKP